MTCCLPVCRLRDLRESCRILDEIIQTSVEKLQGILRPCLRDTACGREGFTRLVDRETGGVTCGGFRRSFDGTFETK